MTSTPKRIQRKRTKNWKSPENTIYVGRPSKWGNQYKVGNRTRIEFKVTALDNGGTLHTPYEVFDGVITPQEVVDNYEMHLIYLIETKGVDFSELRGKNLSCWCSLDQPCHADVLLRYANP